MHTNANYISELDTDFYGRNMGNENIKLVVTAVCKEGEQAELIWTDENGNVKKVLITGAADQYSTYWYYFADHSTWIHELALKRIEWKCYISNHLDILENWVLSYYNWGWMHVYIDENGGLNDFYFTGVRKDDRYTINTNTFSKILSNPQNDIAINATCNPKGKWIIKITDSNGNIERISTENTWSIAEASAILQSNSWRYWIELITKRGECILDTTPKEVISSNPTKVSDIVYNSVINYPSKTLTANATCNPQGKGIIKVTYNDWTIKRFVTENQWTVSMASTILTWDSSTYNVELLTKGGACSLDLIVNVPSLEMVYHSWDILLEAPFIPYEFSISE